MRVATISIGDELLAGDTLDSNSQRLARSITSKGWRHVSHQAVGDGVEEVAQAIALAAGMSTLVICSGGLGPTLDDVTREGLAQALGEPLERDKSAEAHIRKLFEARGYAMPESNVRQAMRPPSARMLENTNGTAPGMIAALGETEIVLLPGPPRELVPMLEALLASRGGQEERIRVIRACGLGESMAAEKIAELMRRGNDPLLGITVSDSILTARIRAREATTTIEELDDVERQVRKAWEPWVFGTGDDSLQGALAGEFSDRGLTLATAESCTGGLIGTMLTEVPGSSTWYLGGWVSYQNIRKEEDLGVPEECIAQEGAVSEATACAMATGARNRTGADYVIATTGIAGPGGGSEEKPVGTVWVGLASPDGVEAIRFRFSGTRSVVRDRTAKAALQSLRLLVLGTRAPLLWQESGR